MAETRTQWAVMPAVRMAQSEPVLSDKAAAALQHLVVARAALRGSPAEMPASPEVSDREAQVVQTPVMTSVQEAAEGADTMVEAAAEATASVPDHSAAEAEAAVRVWCRVDLPVA